MNKGRAATRRGRGIAGHAGGRGWLPDVLFFADDYIASGAMVALLHEGVRIPEDVRVASLYNKGLGPVAPLTFALLCVHAGHLVALKPHDMERDMVAKSAKKVLLFLPADGGGAIGLNQFTGVKRATETRRWDLFVAERLRRKEGALRLLRSPGGGSVGELLNSVQPDGIIVIGDAVNPSSLRRPGRRAIPSVFITNPEVEASVRSTHVSVAVESASCAQLAADELFRTGFGDYAFLSWPGDPPWSRERGGGFARHVVEAGRKFHPFQPPSGGGGTDLVEHLSPFLDSLPKPCGIFAANDILGEAALRVCEMHGWNAPQDIAVVGVDNLDFICETTAPTLSSVSRDLEGEGRAGVELLEEWLDMSDGRPTSRAIPASHVVRRASSRFSRDRRVGKALEFIRVHACEDHFGPGEVVGSMGVSRSLADGLFHSLVGCTILDEIHAVRLARAKDLLSKGVEPDVVAAQCGYASHADFRRVFRHRVGVTVRHWTLAARI